MFTRQSLQPERHQIELGPDDEQQRGVEGYRGSQGPKSESAIVRRLVGEKLRVGKWWLGLTPPWWHDNRRSRLGATWKAEV